jgi:hypothetical protein
VRDARGEPTIGAVGERKSKRRARRDDLRWAAKGGIAAAAVGFGGMAIVGTATSFEARRLLEAILPSLRFAAAGYVATGATILALMLTLITFSISHELEFHVSYYRRIREISALATVVIVGAVLFLMFLSFPLGEADVDMGWYLVVYYALLLCGAVLGGMFISVVLMLLYAVQELISVGEDPEVNDIVVVATEEEPVSDH